jgi:two-component system sensor histidine kinase MtrB
VQVTSDLTVMSDRKALELIVANLVRNGLVHGQPPVSVSAAQDNGVTRIRVEDQGQGISEDFVSRLFEPFARAHGAEARPGTGLGLAIAQSYARQLGGRLVYEAGRPTGASFTLVLPESPPPA